MPTKEELLDFSRFDANAILRGAQLTLVGGKLSIQRERGASPWESQSAGDAW